MREWTPEEVAYLAAFHTRDATLLPQAEQQIPEPGKAICETCGDAFEREQGYYEVDDPVNQIIGYAYCAECCHW